MIIDSIKKGGVYGLLFSLKLTEASRVTTLIPTRSKVPASNAVVCLGCTDGI